jgi:hypothetical protein
MQEQGEAVAALLLRLSPVLLKELSLFAGERKDLFSVLHYYETERHAFYVSRTALTAVQQERKITFF